MFHWNLFPSNIPRWYMQFAQWPGNNSHTTLHWPDALLLKHAHNSPCFECYIIISCNCILLQKKAHLYLSEVSTSGVFIWPICLCIAVPFRIVRNYRVAVKGHDLRQMSRQNGSNMLHWSRTAILIYSHGLHVWMEMQSPGFFHPKCWSCSGRNDFVDHFVTSTFYTNTNSFPKVF